MLFFLICSKRYYCLEEFHDDKIELEKPNGLITKSTSILNSYLL